MSNINGQEVGPIGYGLMGLTWRATPVPEEQAFEAMKTALDGGCNFWNGGVFYGTPSYNSMVLLERYFAKHPEDADKVVLSIKGGIDVTTLVPDGSAEGVRRSIDSCLAQLKGRKKIDVFECARRDAKVPLSETLGTIQREYVETGKVGGVALSEVSAATIHEAVKVTKIVAVEVELSLWSLDVLHNGVAAACAQHGIPLVAYSPLGRGFLTGQVKSAADLPEGDFRHHLPRFQKENMDANAGLLATVQELASKKSCTPAQLAINWVRCLSERPGMPRIIPIPGATAGSRVKENSTLVELTDADMSEIQEAISKFEVKGNRYPDGALVNT
ncbi:pyridoxal reductase [Gaeumannomyces tritici R3-111a-1]|uniref:Pyridoxal reductase n=1 Tax=Gaeumannomyces tritici (strain R3-111a-1) TaxID=644352 RepID=J3PHC8_GAET3|nr:pyridoxal reductase [Gaeumannomyces tritici R3-111a-1]EJT69288.1 pyridoxal reductase [Gaeumannomyces tritici R3-111a-1]